MSRKWIILTFSGVLTLIWLFSLPGKLFHQPTSTIMYDSEGKLLNARVAADGQWRFPENTSIPENYRIALLAFEDQYFYYHPGVNPGSVMRAFVQNLRGTGVKSGASTLTMQVIRLSRQGKQRNIGEKIIEMFLATRLELRYSKRKILLLYASHAPFGGNVVGIQAASWRYFGHSQEELSWAEAATLAVLPNSPALIFPGRNQQLLLEKRDRLLQKLHQRGHIDTITLELALAEPLPGRPHTLPRRAPHLFDRAIRDGKEGQHIHTTVNGELQRRLATVLLGHHQQIMGNQIHNLAALVANVKTGEILAYWGNAPESDDPINARQVDIISSRRSPGSLLKPFLYAAMLQEGLILPHSLVPDIPTHFQGFSPENFTRTYDGAVPASRALARSLNIPAVRMLRDYHPDRFLWLLRSCGITTLDKPASHYGLSMILGGGEVSMWEIAGAYASMARTLQMYNHESTEPFNGFFPLRYQSIKRSAINNAGISPFDAGVLWLTFEAMIEAARPDTEANWQLFGRTGRIAWKTGTSFGNRDAWSVGVTPDHVVAVWVGNATGEGRPSITGVGVAAPIMFDIFGILPRSGWFEKPWENMNETRVCRHSGLPPSVHCYETDTTWTQRMEFQGGVCPHCKTIHLHKQTGKRVNSACASIADMEPIGWFVLPPVQEYYFQQRNPFYKPLPPMEAGCTDFSLNSTAMQWIYPTETTTIFIPVELDGTPGETILRIAHRVENTRVHWHLNEVYQGTTFHFHEMAFRPPQGKHTFTITDDMGNMLQKELEIRLRR